jgi:acyl transferase domain-containing protein/NADPH:quinone reductase-like Zn-dependent oxidoreductase
MPAAGGEQMTPLKRVFLALEETRARLAAVEAAAGEPIAIIGLGCRVPGGAHDAASFWALMRDAVDAVSPLPADRWDVEGTYDPDPDAIGRIATRAGGFLGDLRGFDPALFGITRREAQHMDPQQRLLLEVAWEALENAGQPPDRLAGSSTGVYVGVTGSDYAYLQFETRDRSLLDAHFASGIAHSIASGRLSYLLGLRGPALTIDTACSSSLAAVHLACQALRAGDCRMALAGGVNLILSPDLYIALSHARMLAPDGRCKTFDAAADGFARGEGCGVIVLKRLSHAQTDGDRILALVRGTALNQDGASSGLTAPNGPAQEAVIRMALARAGVAPREVGYIEAHGTGTQLGDPLEVRALGAVFGADRDPTRPLLIGSVKTNLGHLEAAAGVTGLIKLVLALQHRQIPAHLHFHTPSPHIAWDELPVRVPTTLTDWEPIDGRRVAGVSSFGFSGTNAHIVVEEAPEPPVPAGSPRVLHLFVLSARDATALTDMARRYLAAFATLDDRALPDVCFTAAAGRAHLPHRAELTVRSMDELRARLQAVAEGRAVEGVRNARVVRRDPARIACLFTGQGSQYAGMAQRLEATEPIFRAALDRCAEVLDARLPRPLRDVLFSTETPSPLDETSYTQPALFAVEYALAELWRSWGVQPDVLIGHSVGEIVAACIGGVLSLPDALALVAERGRLMQSLPAGGAMAAIFAPGLDVAAAVAPYSTRLAVAAFNGPTQTVVSGAVAAVDDLCASFTARGVRCQRLPVSHAFHSPLVEPMLDAFEARAARTNFQSPTLRIISNLTGTVADAREIVQARYWRRHVREAVRFADGIKTLAGLQPDVCLEIGPHPTLLAFAEANFAETGVQPALVASLRKSRGDDEQLVDALAALYLEGVAIDWRAVWSAIPHRWIDLPAYAFQREPLWFPQRAVGSSGQDTGHPLLGVRLRSALRDVVQFEQVLASDSVPYLADHRVHGQAILPATGFLELALAAGRAALNGFCALQDVAIVEPLRFHDGEARIVQTVVRHDQAGAAAFEILSTAGEAEDWRRHVDGRLQTGVTAPESEPLDAVRERCRDAFGADAHHAQLAARGLDFGPSLHGLRKLWRGTGEALGEVHLPDPSIAGRGSYLLHPALLDACLQVMSAALDDGVNTSRTYLPLAIDRLYVIRQPAGAVWSHARIEASGHSEMLRSDVTVYDSQGIVAALRGIALRAAAGPETDAPLYEIAWPELTSEIASWVPAPDTLQASVGHRFVELAGAEALDDYQQAFIALEGLCAEWIAAALSELGWQPTIGDHVSRDGLAEQLGIVPRYGGLLGRYLDILAEDGVLTRGKSHWTVARPLAPRGSSHLADAARALLARHPTSHARIALSERCGTSLAGILRGAVDPLEQLFPGGSTELAESLYRDTPEARAWNQLLRDTVIAAVVSLPAGQRLRVLEVGGGTGGTTAWVAPVLPADRCEYLFTDVGPSMVLRAREKFVAHAFMSFQPFDLEQPSSAQGLGERRFDIILAANVVHATADLRQTLGRLRELLAPGGMLLMLEVAGLERWIDITFGLTDGWWCFHDTDVRADYPLLSRDAWLELLATLGMDAGTIGAPDPRSRGVVLAARRPPTDADRLSPGGCWMVIGDGHGMAAALGERLRSGGQSVVHAVGTEDDHALRALVVRHAHALRGVIHLATVDLQTPEDAASLLPGQQRSLGALITIVQALGACSFASNATPRLCVVTRGAVSIDASGPDLPQTPVIGFAKVVALEHPELRCLRVDLDPLAPLDGQIEALCERLATPGAEDQVARRGANWHAARLRRIVALRDVQPMRLERGSGGVFDELQLRPHARRAPGPNEVEIRVVAAGLNFRDVMNAVAMRDDPEPLGGECAGRIVAVGEGVSGFTVGDHVVGIAEASFATYATTSAALVRTIPDGVSFAEAATLPFAFMTADHALHTLGGLTRGETVLIHAGAGGVGMAAIQLAQATGATVIATAGSDTKRAVLRDRGVAHVLDSRTLEFEAQIRELTHGRGVDVVLNSLAGDFIGASVRCLTPQGRFLEIGKRDIWTPQRFAEIRPQGRYHAIDLNAMRTQDPAATATLFERVLQRVERRALRPLPVQTFPLERSADAFRFMAMGRHVGKVVLIQHDRDAAALRDLNPRGSYLITGGLSGLGLLTAQRMAERGARHLLLVGRRAASPAALAAIAAMRTAGAQVLTLQADIARIDDVRRVLDAVPPATPLRGIVHSAGLLEDGALLQQRWPRFQAPLGPKVDGSWYLHALTRRMRLDFFVMYSSLASVVGSSGQANHAAANAFMDALAERRHAEGLPSVSVAWGAWSEIGAAADRQLADRIDARGLEALTRQRGLEWLDAAMAGDRPSVAVFPVRWSDFQTQAQAAWPMFADLRQAARSVPAAASSSPAVPRAALLEQFAEESPSRRHELLIGLVGEHVARVIGASSADAIDPHQPHNELGLDSLMAVELRNRLGTGLGVARSLPATLVFDHPTIEAISTYLATTALVATDTLSPETTLSGIKPAADVVDAIDELSDAEIEQLFASKMQRS